MAKDPYRERIVKRVAIQREMVEHEYWICCLNCTNYSSTVKQTCTLADQQIPLDVIVTGCPSWEAEIPF